MRQVFVAAVALAASGLATNAGAEEWNAFSSSARVAYLADLSSISVLGDDTSINVARVALPTAAGDYSHKVNEYAVRCAANQARIVVEVEYGPDGAELDRYPETDVVWDTPAPNSLGALIKSIACDSVRAQGENLASIKAYVDGQGGQ